jgi:hypothetical protein
MQYQTILCHSPGTTRRSIHLHPHQHRTSREGGILWATVIPPNHALGRPNKYVLVGCLLPKVGLGPKPEEERLGCEVGRGQNLTRVQESFRNVGLRLGYAEGGLEALLLRGVGWNGIIVPMVELPDIWPPLLESDASEYR